MSIREPLVSVAIPVFNGDTYLEKAISSVLDQTYSNLELIICDNASTDRTAQICREFADADSRVRYRRNDRNFGAAPNFNHAVSLATGEYFKWLAADEFIEPTFVERCLEALGAAPHAVVACTYYVGHNELKREVAYRDYDLILDQPLPGQRLAALLRRKVALVLPIWGLQRTAVMRTTGLIRSFVRSDHVFVAEMALRGTFAQVPEYLHHIRTHSKAYHRVYTHARTDSAAEARWFDASNDQRVYLPHWRRLREYLVIALAATTSRTDKARMIGYLLGPFSLSWRGRLGADLVIALLGPERYRRIRGLLR